ncbi:MAG: Wzt carbohydrate-binding domain-containing protein, partial [Lachnospiraceae bacterium]|nr:Wzt carbohydrate-binding domain-containing protein [Lachnospiraceae bacterium]
VAEGRPGEMVDLYKKILAGQYDQLEEMVNEREAANSVPGNAQPAPKAHSVHAASDGGLMRASMTVNPNVSEYGNGKAEIYDFGILDKDGRLTNLILKGERFTIREKIRFSDTIEAPIFTYTFRDKKGNDLSGTNTMFEGQNIRSVHAGDEYEVEFTQQMDLQGGEYLLSMSCTGFEQGEHVVYHRLYDLLNLTVISNKNTVGVFDMNSHVTTRFIEQQKA